MRQKHPRASVPLLKPDPDSTLLHLQSSQIVKSIKTFKRGSAPGPSGLRAEHLKVAVGTNSPIMNEKSAALICRLCNLILSGGLPKAVAPYFCGARLHGAQKKDGGVRPIAVGEIMRRLVSKCAASAVSDKAATILSPLQLGVGIRNGCEALIHAAWGLLDQDHEGIMLMQIDFLNAFNLADRKTAFEEVKRLFPELAHWVSSCYGVEAILMYKDTTFMSTRGFHQGDPLHG